MSWQPHHNVEGKGKRVCKIRKRGCSSSSSSSLIQKYRFKRAILVQKRAGSTTPVPTWITATTKSPSLAIPSVEFPSKGSPKNVSKTKEGSVSARKLAATLWESNKIPSPQAMEDLEKKDRRRKPPIVAKMPHSLPPSLSDPSYTPISEIEAHSRGNDHDGCITGIGNRLKDVRNSLATSKELLKVLNHVCGLEERNSSSVSLISALRVELDRARVEVDQLIRERRSNFDETEYLMRCFAEEKAAWKRKERERTRDAIACVAEELEVEKKLRRQTERLNKKLGKELADTNASLSKATKELKSEKRAKEILEQVCDELAKGMGEDRATAEELKRETAKVREEVEKEREMLHFADVLREERVQMKLSEAKHHFEEKNAVVEKLRNELETYLGTKIDGENGNGSPNLQRIKELEAYLKNINFGNCQAAKKDVDKGEVMANGEECEADDSADSDLHSIELNMDNNDKSYNWSYASGNRVEGESKRIPTIRKENKGTKSRSEKLSWGSICLERGSSDSADWDYEDEIKRYKSVKSLRDHILSSNKIAPIGGFSSPTRQWSQSMHFQEPCSNGLPVLKGDDLKQPKVVSTRGEGRTSIS
ncbi:probable DNA double-strand break repair Rad50 ATPase isoform X2 [Gossypium hirsutum]|uniref:Probable DNA double-strand break repair Rad50 ATPase isoform X2 n=1 Tax=Gossypium hirsutum TaxID=3635 RepID=A0A1U8JFZ1_GOSHI|nr:probable DNA double-strand break repair Rad50 ATPase isoform X2 [Gossypium hirsutum]